MTAVIKLLDMYKDSCCFKHDAQVAKSLHTTRQAVNQWRSGRATPSEDHIVRMAEFTDKAPEKWLAEIAMDKAPHTTKRYWQRLLNAAAIVAVGAEIIRLAV